MEIGAAPESIPTTFAWHVLRFQMTKIQLPINPKLFHWQKNCPIFGAGENGTLRVKNRQISLQTERFQLSGELIYDPFEIFNQLKYQKIGPCSWNPTRKSSRGSPRKWQNAERARADC